MRQKPGTQKPTTEQVVKDTSRRTRKQHCAFRADPVTDSDNIRSVIPI